MYHIKSDRRSRNTAAQIARGFQECLKTTPLSAITVSDIHRATGISRATFYRLFDTPEDVLCYLCEQSPEGIEQCFQRNPPNSPEQVFPRIIAMGMESHDLLKALVDNRRYDLIWEYTERQFRLFDQHFSILPQDMDENQYEYMISALSMTIVATMSTWVRRGRVDSPEQIAAYTGNYLKILNAMISGNAPQTETEIIPRVDNPAQP